MIPKSITLLSLITIVLCSCTTGLKSAAAPSAPEEDNAVPTPMPTTGSVETQVPATQPTPKPTASEPDMLSATMISDLRVIPSDLDPTSQAAQVILEYQQALSDDGQHLRWFLSPTANGGLPFKLNLKSLVPSPDDTITLMYPLQVSISLTDITTSRINTIEPGSGGGGGPSSTFPKLFVHAGTYDWQPDMIFLSDLSAASGMSVSYDLIFLCTEPGVFDILIKQPYVYTSNGLSNNQVFTYELLFACPNSFTAWSIGLATQQLERGPSWIFTNDQHYIQIP